MLTPEEEKKLESLKKEYEKNRDGSWFSNDERFSMRCKREILERKMDKIRQSGHSRDKHPNMGLPKGSLYYINYDNDDD